MKIIEIKSCIKCPFLRMKSESIFCIKSAKVIPKNAFVNEFIPAWCELKDKK